MDAAQARPPAGQRARRADPRPAASRQRVLLSAFDLLTEAGLGAFTIDDLAKRSGVAKTTIYRHWPDRTALIIDACQLFTDGEEPPPDTGSVANDVRAVLTTLAHLLTTARWSTIVPSLVDAAERDPAIAEVHAALQRRHAAPLRAALERARDRGEIPEDTDCAALAAALRGPLYLRRWFVREPIDADFIDQLVRLLIEPLTKIPPMLPRPRPTPDGDHIADPEPGPSPPA